MERGAIQNIFITAHQVDEGGGGAAVVPGIPYQAGRP